MSLTTIESIEVDVDASEVEQVVPVKILNHKVWHHENGRRSVWVRLQFNDGFKADGHVRSTFLGDSEEGLDLLRAYIHQKNMTEVVPKR